MEPVGGVEDVAAGCLDVYPNNISSKPRDDCWVGAGADGADVWVCVVCLGCVGCVGCVWGADTGATVDVSVDSLIDEIEAFCVT